MKILAVDTSSKNCSVAILEVTSNKEFKIIAYENSDDEKTHSQKLMPMIDSAFSKSNLSLDNIDLLVSCLGPGSFTGIRIGISTIKAFADAKSIPTVGVSSLESLAYNTMIDTKSSVANIVNASGLNYICSIIDCKNDNVYAGLFSNKKSENKSIEENFISLPPAMDNMADTISNTISKVHSFTPNFVDKFIFIGDGAALHKDYINLHFDFEDGKIVFSEDNTQSAISLGICGYQKYLNGEAGDSNNISPLYLRKSQAERAQN